MNHENFIINQKTLCAIANVRQKGRLIRWLNSEGIRYKYTASGEVFTTPEQLNDSFTESKKEAIVFGYGKE